MKAARDLIVRERDAGGAGAFLAAVDAELAAAAIAGESGVMVGLSLRTLDQVKKGFDSVLARPKYHRTDLPGSPFNPDGRSLNTMLKSFRAELDRLTTPATNRPFGLARTSDYATARKIYAGDMEVINALKDGEKILTMRPQEITRYMADLSNAGKQAFRSGGTRAIMDRVEGTGDLLSAANRIFANTSQRGRIRAMFPDGKSYREFRKGMVAEQQFTKTRSEALGGSQTEARQAQRRDMFSRAGEMIGIMSAGVGPGHTLLKAGVAKTAGNRFVNALLGDNTSAYHLNNAKTLFGRNQAMNQHSLDMLFDPTVWKTMPEVARHNVLRALLAGSTQQIGQAVAVRGVAADSQ